MSVRFVAGKRKAEGGVKDSKMSTNRRQGHGSLSKSRAELRLIVWRGSSTRKIAFWPGK